MDTPRIYLDAMGGDHAPDAIVAGALEALRANGIRSTLVGRRDEVRGALAGAGAADALEVVDAADVISMDEDVAVAVRSKRDASVRVAARLVAEAERLGEPAAMVSAGSTGATLAAALFDVGRLDAVRRPVVAAVLPVAAGGQADGSGAGVVLVDAGGSADVQADALVAHARMGAAYASARGVVAPRIGLLNVGAEPGKGNALAREAFGLLQSVEGFVGNVEPDVVLAGGVDVVVTDGFTGNVLLKTIEAAGVVGGDPGAGAAMLLGVRGQVLVAHGAADAAEIARAVTTAASVAVARLSRRIAERLEGGEGGA